MDDAVARYLAASEANDIPAIMATLAPEAELVSPISGRMVFRGHADLRLLLGAIYGSLTALQWTEKIGDGASRVAIGSARVGPLRLTDAMAFDLTVDGTIWRIRPHLRPWLALTLLTLILTPKVARHPGLVWRALRAR